MPILLVDAVMYIRKQMPGKKPRSFLSAGLIAATIILVSLGLHEVGHAVMANWMGIKIVAAGFVGLYAYVTPEVSISQMVPYKEILTAFAGPLTNFLIAGVFVIPVAIYGESIMENTLQYIVHMNFLLAVYNLLPIPILDGGTVLHGAVRIFGQDSGFAWLIVLAATFLVLTNWSFIRQNIVNTVESRLEVL